MQIQYRDPNSSGRMRPTGRLSILLHAFEIWLLISVAETLHGIARIAIIQPIVGDFRARQIAVLTGSLIILAIAVFFRNWMPLTSRSDAATVGVLWVGLTIAFEVILGRFVIEVSWARIMEDYNILDGGLMVFGLLVMFASPFVVRWYRRREELKVVADGHSAA
jgi:hypothetical protein